MRYVVYSTKLVIQRTEICDRRKFGTIHCEIHEWPRENFTCPNIASWASIKGYAGRQRQIPVINGQRKVMKRYRNFELLRMASQTQSTRATLGTGENTAVNLYGRLGTLHV